MILVETAAGFLYGIEQRLLVRKMAEQRGQIRKGFMECGDVVVGALREIGANTIKNCMCRLMDNDVVRKAGENRLSGKIAARIGLAGSEVAEQYSFCRRCIGSVCRNHRMRI